MLTSIDHEGSFKGFDFRLLNQIFNLIKVPLIVSGGFKDLNDLIKIKNDFKGFSVAIAAALHYKNK